MLPLQIHYCSIHHQEATRRDAPDSPRLFGVVKPPPRPPPARPPDRLCLAHPAAHARDCWLLDALDSGPRAAHSPLPPLQTPNPQAPPSPREDPLAL